MEVSAYRHCRFIPDERNLGAHWIGGWVGPRDGADAVKNDEVTSYADIRNPIPQFTARSIVNILNAIFRLRVECITGHLR